MTIFSSARADGQRARHHHRTPGEVDPLRVFIDGTVPPDKREAARETVAATLAATLKEHPHFANLAVLVGRDARRGGWQVTVVALDPALTPLGAELTLDEAVLEGVREALARL